MIKHGLIQSRDHLEEVRNFDTNNPDWEALRGMIADSVAIKDAIVFQDPNEKGIRKALNFGHTIGHAFESYSYSTGKPILHGFAVAYGMIAELYLSHLKCNLSAKVMNELSSWLLSIYGKFEIGEKDFDVLYNLMTHDKKNEGKKINFTLIPRIGEVLINQDCSREEILEALKFYKRL